MKLSNNKFNKTTGCALCVLALLFFNMCGKKTLPVPIVHFNPPPAEIFSHSITMSQLTLTWRFSVQDIPDLSIPQGFLVKRSKLNLDEGDCKTCPPEFHIIAKVALNDSGTYSYIEDLEKGFSYAFKVTPVSNEEKTGPDSNTIAFTF